MFEKILNRPTLAIVISLIIVFLGILSLNSLPIAQFPSIAPPRVLVSITYPGANADVLTNSVLIPLEQAINGVKNMRYIVSDATSAGEASIQVYFEPGTSINAAIVNVQNRVNLMKSRLPELVQREGILVSQEMPSMLMYVNVFSSDPSADEKFIYNFASVNVATVLRRIPGVGNAKILGTREFAMRIWLNLERMRAYDISAEDVMTAMQEQSVIGVPGRLGQATGKVSQSIEYSLRYQPRYSEPEQYENIILRATPGGEVLHLKDVAEVELGSEFYDLYSNINGSPSAAIVLKQNPGTNARDVIRDIKKELKQIKSESFPPGMEYTVTYDVSTFLDASIDKVIRTLIEAFVLVSLVVFVFLGDLRSTLIPVLAVPVSLIGAFFAMQVLGLSINMITLFALVLAIGIVIDDAIVVVEAVHAKMREDRVSPYRASKQVVQEISGAIIAITLAMTAVFVPVCFMGGPVGTFFRQFGITMASAIVLSAIVALTLTPVLCAIILRPPSIEGHREINRFSSFRSRIYAVLDRLTFGIASRLWRIVPVRLFSVFIAFGIGFGVYTLLRQHWHLEESSALVVSVIAAFGLNQLLGSLLVVPSAQPSLLTMLLHTFDRFFERLTVVYASIIKYVAPLRLLTLVVIAGFSYAVYAVGASLPTGFIPNEDQGMIYGIIQTPPGSTLEYTNEKICELQALAEKTEGVKSVCALAGYEVLTEGRGSNAGTCLINLETWSDRNLTTVEIMEALEKNCERITNCKVEFYQPPAVPGFGTAGGISFRMLDKTFSYDYKALGEVNEKFMEGLSKRKELNKVFTFFANNYPQYELIIDNSAAMQKGVTIGKAMDNLAVLIGSTYDLGFVRFGKFYKVYVQASARFRRIPKDLSNLYIRNDRGEEVPYTSFMRLELIEGLNEITRYNLYPSAAIQASPAPGYSMGQAIDAVTQVAETLPHGYGLGWEGIAYEESRQGNSAIYILLIVIAFVYLVLAAQYESFVVPIGALASLPLGIFGALWFLYFAKLTNNVYAQVGLVMLVGLLGKNAILIFEFAIQKRRAGLSIFDSTVQGAKLRLRPILMTSFAFVTGMLPLVYATGPGANGNRTIGTAASGGMLIGTLIGVFVIPGLCYFFVKIVDGRKLIKDESDEPLSEVL